MGHPPKQGHLDAADFSADFLRIFVKNARLWNTYFCVTLEHLFFKRQNVEEKSAENLRKNLCENLRTKNLSQNGR